MYFFTHALTTYRRLHDMYSATFKRKPSEGVGHDLDERLVWLVRSWLTPSLGFRLKVAEYMPCKQRQVVRACVKKYTPAF